MIRESFPRPFATPRSPSNPSICHTPPPSNPSICHPLTSSKTSRRFTSSRSGWTCGQINRIQNPTQNPRDSLRKQAGQAAGAAPTLRYGPTGDSACPLRLGVYYGRKVPFRPVHTARMPPFFPREQRVSPDWPAAVQGAKRRSEPLTARTDLERFAVRERRSEPTELLSQYTWAQLLILEIVP